MKKATTFKIERVDALWGPMHAYCDDVITQQLREFGAHTRNELAMVLHFIKPGDRIIDVGAHIGTFAIPLAIRAGKHGQVYAFEGFNPSFQLLKKNAELNHCEKTLCCIQGIVTDVPRQYSGTVPENNTGMCRFFPLNDDALDYSENCVVLDQHQLNNENCSIHLLKIDAEGMELNVMKGANSLIEKHKPIVYAEINARVLGEQGRTIEELDKFLKDRGYHFFLNVGKRNSNNDRFTLKRFDHLTPIGTFFDVLAIHRDSPRYPTF